MAVEIPNTGTEYTANAITFSRGGPGDVTSVGVYHDEDPNKVPAVGDFTTVILVEPNDPLGDGTHIDVLALIGPDGGDVTLTAGDYQRWVMVKTSVETIIRKVDTITIL